jgi:hypothetical protein
LAASSCFEAPSESHLQQSALPPHLGTSRTPKRLAKKRKELLQLHRTSQAPSLQQDSQQLQRQILGAQIISEKIKTNKTSTKTKKTKKKKKKKKTKKTKNKKTHKKTTLLLPIIQTHKY